MIRTILQVSFWHNSCMSDNFLLVYASSNGDNQPFIDCQISDAIEWRELSGSMKRKLPDWRVSWK